MGYPADQATLSAENDRLRLQDPSLPIPKMSGKKQPGQTKEEQEKLIEKLSKHSKKEEEEKKGDAVTNAAGVDFGKSVQEQDLPSGA